MNAGGEAENMTQNVETLFRELNSRAGGLSGAEAKKRLAQFGANALEEKRQSALKKFLGYFWGADPVDD